MKCVFGMTYEHITGNAYSNMDVIFSLDLVTLVEVADGVFIFYCSIKYHKGFTV